MFFEAGVLFTPVFLWQELPLKHPERMRSPMPQAALYGVYKVSAVSASDILKRNTDSLRCAVENDVFASLPQDSLLDELEMGY